ncbi:DNA-formamidopyrimidine glycosylase family protein [Lutispora sp.]|uniref:DNA-formamidopyrimidine glycosylase family protein n=1 Tax=Lutispora sp. TaxID=2828727 RepID=UPI002B1FF229|nr:DNA-formamidopyrimidine glycosylase family protein [Lutispora sp.]MEA4962552.1 endonuclease VIII [Lutispora sp.]
MVELPEAVVLANQINDTLIGKKIRKATANHTPHTFAWYTGDPAGYHELLAGKTILYATSIGEHVEIKADDMILHISTPLRYHAEGDKLPQKHQLLLEFEDDTAVSATIQMWGCLFCFGDGDQESVSDYYPLKISPSPLSDSFDRTYFNSLFDEKTAKLSAKAFLATEQRIPGLGNGVLQDVLWTAKIHPKRKMSSLTPGEIDDMYDAIKHVLKQMTIKGGRDTEKDLFGHPGGYKTVLSKNTVDMPCPACGSFVKKEAYLGGSIYYCKGCQQL